MLRELPGTLHHWGPAALVQEARRDRRQGQHVELRVRIVQRLGAVQVELQLAARRLREGPVGGPIVEGCSNGPKPRGAARQRQLARQARTQLCVAGSGCRMELDGVGSEGGRAAAGLAMCSVWMATRCATYAVCAACLGLFFKVG